MPASVSYTFQAGTTIQSGAMNQNFTDLVSYLNGANVADANISSTGLSADSLTSTVNQQLGLSETGTTRRGKSIIATEEARTNTAYGTLTTPDQVTSVVLPTDGLIGVAYQALVKSSVSGAGRAAIFVGANQLKMTTGGTPALEAAPTAGTDSYRKIVADGLGLIQLDENSAATSDVTTGQTLGGTPLTTPTMQIEASGTVFTFEKSGASAHDLFGVNGVCHIFAAAGTYTISVQFKASSGSVTAKERKLWVWTIGF